MSSDALFGPDGTQLPDPAPVLADPLIGPGTVAAPPTGADPVMPVAPVPRVPGADDMREAIMRAMVDDAGATAPVEPVAAEPVAVGPVESTGPIESVETMRTPPEGLPAQPVPARPVPPVARPPAAQLRQRPLAAMRQPGSRNRKPKSSAGGWIGCVVVLIFIVAFGFSLIRELIGALTGS